MFFHHTFNVTVTVDVVCVAETIVRLPFVGFILTLHDHVLNLRLVGNVRINVTLVPTLKSLAAHSVIVMFDNIVHHEP